MYGWVVAAYPLGQGIFCPIFGAIANRLGSVRLTCLAGAALYVSMNVLYASLSLFPEEYRFPLLLFSRFMVGAASGRKKMQKEADNVR